MLNERLLTVEDTNSIIEHFGRGFTDYYVLDTRLLLTPDTWFAYDFVDVYRTTGSISFTVKNSLWTGGFRVLNSNVSSPTVSVSSGTITVSKTGLECVVLELELSPEFTNESIFELDYEVEYTPVIRPFYESIALTMGFLDGETPVTNLAVTDKVKSQSLTTDNNGCVTVVSSANSPKDYDYTLEAVNNGVTVDYKFPYERMKVELPIRLVNSTVYRDKVNSLEFELLLDSQYSINPLNQGVFVLRVNGTDYRLARSGDRKLTVDVPVGAGAYLDMSLFVRATPLLEDYRVDYHISTSYVTVDSVSDLITELGSDNPADKIVFTGDTLNNMVSVDSDVSIQFTDDVESTLDNVFVVNNGAVLTLEDLSFTGKGLVNLNNSECIVVNGSFQHCTDTIFKGNGGLTVNGASFNDNYSCIDVNGDVTLTNVLFDLSDETYLDTSTPAFVRCYNDLIVDYCQFNLDLHDLESLGLSYVMLWLGSTGTVNRVNNTNLAGNDLFPIRQNRGTVDVTSTNYQFTSDGDKCIVWTLQDTNTVYSNKLNVTYIGGE